MTEKNRFSRLLDSLMADAELKNCVLANELQYDVSYISKWISGRMIPSEKSADKILEGISRTLVESCSETGKQKLLNDYQVVSEADLQMAIYDNLEAEYIYVRDLKKNTGSDVAQKTFFFPELDLARYVAKMHHPVLRRVKSLDVVAVMDLMAIDKEQRLWFTKIRNEYLPEEGGYPNVHYRMLINICEDKWDYINDTLFLVNLLTDNTAIDFSLYGAEQDPGRMIFSVKDEFFITGMLINSKKCISVSVSEETENCSVIYNNVRNLCTNDKLLFQRIMMIDMLMRHDYIHAIISPNLRWGIGHITEQFMPEDVFEEVLTELESAGTLTVNPDDLRTIQHMNYKAMQESDIRLLIQEEAVSNFVVHNEIDYYNRKVHLNSAQMERCMEHMIELCRSSINLEIRMIYGNLGTECHFADNECVFIGDTMSYMRMKNVGSENNVVMVSSLNVHKILQRTFEMLWDYGDGAVVSDKSAIIDYLNHMVDGIHLVSHMNK